MSNDLARTTAPKRLCRLIVLITLAYGVLAILPAEWHHWWATVPAAVLVLWADNYSSGAYVL